MVYIPPPVDPRVAAHPMWIAHINHEHTVMLPRLAVLFCLMAVGLLTIWLCSRHFMWSGDSPIVTYSVLVAIAPFFIYLMVGTWKVQWLQANLTAEVYKKGVTSQVNQ